MKRRFAIRAVRFGPKPTLSSWYQKREFHGTDEKRGSFEGAIRIPLRALLFLFNDLAFLCIPCKSLKFLTLLFSIPTAPNQSNRLKHYALVRIHFSVYLRCTLPSRIDKLSRSPKDSRARRSKFPGSPDSKAKTQTDRVSIRRERTTRTRTEPRYEISLGKDPRPERNNVVLRARKVLRSLRTASRLRVIEAKSEHY
jgi:hypothetical protein